MPNLSYRLKTSARPVKAAKQGDASSRKQEIAKMDLDSMDPLKGYVPDVGNQSKSLPVLRSHGTLDFILSS